MAETPSTMLALGTPAPDFALPDTNGNMVSLKDFEKAPALLVMFICNHCPFVKLVRDELAALGKEYQAKGVGIVAIMPNDVEHYPDDHPSKMAKVARETGFTFPYLYDATQEVAKAYRAACTPDFFLFDKARRLVYRWQLDDARPGNGKPVTGKDLRTAIEAVLAGKKPGAKQKPSIGCNIKWKPGKEPDYYRH